MFFLSIAAAQSAPNATFLFSVATLPCLLRSRQAMAPGAAEPVTASNAQHPPVVIRLPDEALRRIQQAEQKFANARMPQGAVPGEVLHGHGEDDEAPMQAAPAATASGAAGSASADAPSKGKKPVAAG